MFKKYIIVVLLMVVLCGSCLAKEKYDNKTYKQLLGKALKFDKSLDFEKLRLAYARTSYYNPYDNSQKKTKDEMMAALKAKQYKKSIALANSLLKKNFLNPDAHLICFYAYRGLKDKKNASFHNYMLNGIVASILKSGSGKTPASAYKVISIKEEYAVLGSLSLSVLKQKLIRKNGNDYDKMSVRSKKTGKTFDVYFNVNIPLNWMAERIKQQKKK
ncbi:MAG: DUF4919 domain-containing protein [Candidatus Eremiobacteraeota bacterium]|nr:DUF4919 domain-containing protein [Candidatus Eremiobacteraeota bacterium]